MLNWIRDNDLHRQISMGTL